MTKPLTACSETALGLLTVFVCLPAVGWLAASLSAWLGPLAEAMPAAGW